MHKKLWLGTGWETLIVYDFVKKEYQLMDRYTYGIVQTFPTVVDLLHHIIKPLQKQQPDGV